VILGWTVGNDCETWADAQITSGYEKHAEVSGSRLKVASQSQASVWALLGVAGVYGGTG